MSNDLLKFIYICGLLVVTGCGKARDDGQGQASGKDYTCEQICMDDFVQCILIREKIRLLENTPPTYFKEHKYYKRGGVDETGWWEVRPKGGAFESKKIFSPPMRVCWYELVTNKKTYLIARVADCSPTDSLGGHSTEPPESLKCFDPSTGKCGPPESFDLEMSVGQGGRFVLSKEMELRPCYIRPETVRYAEERLKNTIAINFERVAPYPKSVGQIPIKTTVRTWDGKISRMKIGFGMWDNKGRLDEPALTRFRGYGLEVTGDGEKKIFDRETGFPSNLVSTVFVDGDGNLWVGFFDSQPVHLDLKSGKCGTLKWDGPAAKDASVLQVDGKGTLWIGTFAQGIFKADIAKGRGCRIQGVPECRVNDVKIDGEKVWVATDAGAYLLEPTKR